MRNARQSASRGYTAIEVMMAMTILMIASAGVISMQRAAIQGNVDARRIDTANAIARTWTERLRSDATVWTLPNATNPTSNFAKTALLSKLGPTTALDKFVIPPELGTYSPAFDVLGRDLKVDSDSVLFCTHVRLTWLVQNELLRAEVRVIWPRGLGGLAASPKELCKTVVISDPPSAADRGLYHIVSTVTSIRRNPMR